MEPEKESFLGQGWRFPPAFHPGTHPTQMDSEEEDIRQSLHIILSTCPGERTLQPDFGCSLRRLCFEQMTPAQYTLMREAIEKAILLFEARITLEDILFDDSQTHQGMLLIELVYTVRKTNSRSNLVYPFYLREGTDITNP